MKRLLFLLLLISSPVYAYNVTAAVGYGLDQVGIQASSDVSIICDAGKNLQSLGGGSWGCIASGSSSVVAAGSSGDVQFNTANALDASSRLNWSGHRLLVSGDGTTVLGALDIKKGDAVNQYIVMEESPGAPGSIFHTFKGSGGNAIAMGALFSGGVPAGYTFTDPSGNEQVGINTTTGVLSVSADILIAGVNVCRANGTNCPASASGIVFPKISEDGTAVASASVVNYTTGLKATGSGTIVTVSGDMATATSPGIASFDSVYFSIGNSNGGVSLAKGLIKASEDSAAFTSVDTVDFTTGIKATFNGSKATVSGDMATTTTPGIASFDTTSFSIPNSGGGVVLKTVGFAKGGTGITTSPNNGWFPIGNGGSYTLGHLVSGSNVTITEAAGSITIAATAGSGTPGGSSGDLQYNNASSFGGMTGVSWDSVHSAVIFQNATSLDLSRIAMSASSGQGFVLPSTTTQVNMGQAASNDGSAVWNTSADFLTVGDGSAARKIGGTMIGASFSLASATRYAAPFGSDVNATLASINQFPMPYACHAKNLTFGIVTSPGAGKNWFGTLWKNAVSTNLACIISEPNTSCLDASHDIALVQGDKIAFEGFRNNTANSPGESSIVMECY